MRLRIGIEDDTGIQQAFRIEDRFDLLHQGIGVGPPFEFHERRHVAPGAVLGLQRSVVLLHDHRGDVVQERTVPRDLGCRGEFLREHEVQIPFERMSEDDRLVVPVLAEQGLKVQRGLGKTGERECDILDDHRRARGTHRADGREQPLADVPELVNSAGTDVNATASSWADGPVRA